MQGCMDHGTTDTQRGERTASGGEARATRAWREARRSRARRWATRRVTMLGALGWALLAAAPAAAKPYKAAELITQETFRYGAFEARIRAAEGSGMITAFFLWKDGSELAGTEWQEQDFEIFGKDGRYQSQVMTPGNPRTEHARNRGLPTRAWENYYTFRMEWTPDYLAFYVDGRLVRTETDRQEYSKLLDTARAEPMQLRLSLWAGDSGWSGAFDEEAVPAAAFVDFCEVYDYTPGSGPDGADFTSRWRDDFDQIDGGRWWRANWTFDYAVNDYVSQNMAAIDGKLVLSFTTEAAQGQFPAFVPPNNPTVPSSGGSAPPPAPPPQQPPPQGACTRPPRVYEAEAMLASAGGAAVEGWNLWSNGTLSTNHFFDAGTTEITVIARGEIALGVAPHMLVRVGGQIIGAADVSASGFTEHSFFADLATSGTRGVAVEFDNDYYVEGEADRNLVVDAVVVDPCP